MEPLIAEDVEGAYAIPVLPRDRRGAVDLVLLAAQVERAFEHGLFGVLGGGAAGELAELGEDEAHAVHALLVELGHEAGLPVILDASAADPRRALARIERGRELEATAWLVRAPLDSGVDPFDAGGEALTRLEQLARAAAPAALILEEPAPGALTAGILRRWMEAIPTLAGARILPRGEEGWAELAPLAEDLALFAAGREWASAHRWGARASAGELTSLSPRLAARFAELLGHDIQRALRDERRFQHLLEAHVEPLLRAGPTSPARCERLLALAGGWCDLGPRAAEGLDPRGLARLREAARELAT